jgi:SAM-dependent methyltransferase
MIIPPLDLLQDCTGSTDADDYVNIGKQYLPHFKKRIKPGDRVLDIGCGSGRMAQSLESEGIEYCGWDVSKRAVEWCQEALKIPAFSFRHFDLLNKHYNPQGTILPEEFVMPYEDGSFDFVFLTSVFTHVLSPVVQHYLAEIARVLKRGRCCLATFFLLKDGKRERTPFEFLPYDHVSSVVHQDNPEAIIGYEESWVVGLVDVVEIVYGYQDIVVFCPKIP